MLNKTRILSICVCVSSLSACTTYGPDNSTSAQPYAYEAPQQLYPEGYESTGYNEQPQGKQPVVVPESYHVGVNHSPTPHTDRDKEWVNSQNSQAFTIELADEEKASQVANTLYKAPKNERMGEVKYQRDGKTYYKGLYGSFPSYEAAQQALSALPSDVKQNAGIKKWASVQNGVNN